MGLDGVNSIFLKFDFWKVIQFCRQITKTEQNTWSVNNKRNLCAKGQLIVKCSWPKFSYVSVYPRVSWVLKHAMVFQWINCKPKTPWVNWDIRKFWSATYDDQVTFYAKILFVVYRSSILFSFCNLTAKLDNFSESWFLIVDKGSVKS